MDKELWTEVDEYLSDTLGGGGAAHQACLAANEQAGLPGIDVSPMQGKFLHLIAQIQQAERILEIGTLGGYSGIWLAQALPAGGRLVTLELNDAHARVARSNFDQAGVGEKIEIIVGRAAESLERLVAEGKGPFDLIFIDADKSGYPVYLGWALKLSRVGTVILADNVVRQGQVADPANEDPNVQGAREFLRLAGDEERLCATVIQTLGRKGYDGFLLAKVLK